MSNTFDKMGLELIAKMRFTGWLGQYNHLKRLNKNDGNSFFGTKIQSSTNTPKHEKREEYTVI